MKLDGQAESTFELREVMVDGARLRYVDVGQGDPLVLLHGWPGATPHGGTRSGRSRYRGGSSRRTGSVGVHPIGIRP